MLLLALQAVTLSLLAAGTHEVLDVVGRVRSRRTTGRADHVAVTLNNLAMACQAQHRHPETVELLRRALTVFERTLEPDHPTLAACRENYTNATKRSS